MTMAVSGAPRVVSVAGPDDPAHPCAFTIGTLVTDWTQHAAMHASFEAGGFGTADCEFLAIDNSARGPCASAAQPQTSAFRGLNALLDAARAPMVILCHQDVRLLSDGRDALVARLSELEARDPTWALAGNAGATAPGRLALRISDPHGEDQHTGELPARVMSLDENFIVVRRAARIGFSRDLDGFHLYGADICLAADAMGWSAYVIDFHLRHLSPGRKDAAFQAAERAFRAKWGRALRPRFLQTTCTLLHLTGVPGARTLGRLAERPFAAALRRFTRKPTAHTSLAQGVADAVRPEAS